MVERTEITDEEIKKSIDYINRKGGVSEIGSITFHKAYDDENLIIVKIFNKKNQIYKIYEIRKEEL